MKFFVIFVYSIMVVRSSETSDDTDVDQDDVLRNEKPKEYDWERSSRARMEASLKKIRIYLPSDYNKFELPKPSGDTIMPLFVFLNISKVLDWDELNEFIRLDLRFKVMWTDFKIFEHNNNRTYPGNGKALVDVLPKQEVMRLRRVNNDPNILDPIWKPNLFIEKLLAVNQPVLMAKPLKIRYIPEYGWFEYITRIQLKIDCSMDFRYYPADTQICTVPVRSYAYTKSEMNLSWHRMGVYLSNLEVSSFIIRIGDVEHYELEKTNDQDASEKYDALGFKIFARRRLGYHLIQTYLASSFYIIITTLCFLLPSSMIEARLGMAMTTLLTLTVMFGSVRESTPIVSYTKAIDIWMVGCIFFVFLALYEFTFCTWLKYIVGKNKPVRKNKAGIQNEAFEMDSKFESIEEDVGIGYSSETVEKLIKLFSFLEKYSFFIFLGIFVLYTVVYWSWLLTASNYYNWSVDPTYNKI